MVDFLQNWGGLIVSIVSLVIAVISLVKSYKTQKLQDKVNSLEVKIKQYELEKINQEKESKEKTLVEVNVVKVSNNNYKLRVSNNSDKSVFNVKVKIDKEYNVPIIDNDVLPLETLEPKNSFDLIIIRYMNSASKFYVITEWEDENGKTLSNKQLKVF